MIFNISLLADFRICMPYRYQRQIDRIIANSISRKIEMHESISYGSKPVRNVSVGVTTTASEDKYRIKFTWDAESSLAQWSMEKTLLEQTIKELKAELLESTTTNKEMLEKILGTIEGGYN